VQSSLCTLCSRVKMTKYLLAPDVHACKIEDSAVFLDLRSNSYIAVSPESLPELDDRVEGFASLGPTPSASKVHGTRNASIIDSLLDRQILTQSRSVGRAARRPEICATHALAPGRHRQTPRLLDGSHVAHFISSFSHVFRNLNGKRLAQVIGHIHVLRERYPSPGNPLDVDSVLELLEIFRRLRTFVYTAQDACLLDALVLTMFLHRYRLAPTFAIGIRTKPFVAHAWVQIGDCAIDDRLEGLQTFTPLLAI
jgi:hypothetical protein